MEEITMTLQDYKIDGDKITITKQELQEARDHFCKVADKFKPKPQKGSFDPRYTLYLGEAAVLNDILKLFEPIDFV